jgi:ureidoglycolate lyase
MAPPLLMPPLPTTLNIEPLTPPSFSPFGTAITCPLPTTEHTIPTNSPPWPPLHPSHQPAYVVANQATALKYAPISPLTNAYPGPSRPLMSMFVCFPRTNVTDGLFPVTVLERHPYTTQTFLPLGLGPEERDTYFLVVVAPSLAGTVAIATAADGRHVDVANPPDLARMRAFVARGAQAVTYTPGTWHAPMVVLGRRRVEFVVSQFVSGVADEDCQEVTVGSGVGVDVGGLGLRRGGARL